MKKYLMLFVMALAMVSCSSDDEEEKVDSAIVGRWVCCAYYIEENDFWSYAFIPNTYYVFKSDGTYETNETAQKNGTYTFKNSMLSLDGGFAKKITFSENGQEMEWGNWRYKRQ